MSFDIQFVAQYVGILLAVMGGLVFAVNLIVQVIKNLPGLNKIPTNIVVVVLSIILTMVVFFAGVAIYEIAVAWYMIVAVVVVGFAVSFIAMFGWNVFSKLWNDSKKPEEGITTK